MKNKTKMNKWTFFISVIIVTLCAFFFMKSIVNDGSTLVLRKYGIICLIHFIICFLLFWKLNGKLFSLYSCFLLSFFFFQCGQYVLYGLGVNYNYIYLLHYDISIVNESIIFSMLCNGAAILGGITSLVQKDYTFVKKINSVDNSRVFVISKYLLFGLSLIEIPYLLIRFYIVLRSGYHGVINFEESLPSFLSVIDMLYIPSCILAIIYAQESQTRKLFSILIVTWSLMTALNGDRSSGIAGIIVFGLLYLNGILKRKKANDKGKFIRIIGFFAVCILTLYLIMFAYNFRSQEINISFFSSLGNVIVEVIGELGFSFFPLVLTMIVCPQIESFLYGKSILFSFISSIFPASLDPTGTIKFFYTISKESQNWFKKYYDYSFGLGYSLNAESYANFGFLGFLWIFVLAIIVGKWIAEPNFESDENKFSQYCSLSLLYIWFTMPRRSCYYILNFIVYYVLVIGLLILLLSNGKIKNKRCV